MHISSKGRYGARALLSLAEHFDEGPIPTSTIAEEQGVSRKYLETLMRSLKSADLVQVRLGVFGGYTLSRPPEEINLLEVLEALGENLDIVYCTVGGEGCDRLEDCPTRPLWCKLHDQVTATLRATTLAELGKNGHRECQP